MTAPIVTVEVKGLNRAGKSTIARALTNALTAHGIPVSGHHGVPQLAPAIDGLKKRGLSVHIVETETLPREQVECRPPGLRRVG